MEELVIGLFDLMLLGIYTVVGLIIALLVQLIVYQITGFSIYNWLTKKLFKEFYK